jgi:hypothetical protein
MAIKLRYLANLNIHPIDESHSKLPINPYDGSDHETPDGICGCDYIHTNQETLLIHNTVSLE